MAKERQNKIKTLNSMERKIQFFSFIRYVCLVSLVLAVFFNIFFKMTVVYGDSMYPTITDGSFAVNNVILSKVSNPKRFDIVVVNEEGKYIIKRVIGLPNETIEYKNNDLYINGELVEESFLDDDYVLAQTNNLEIPFTNNYGPLTLGEDEYFVCGDNRRISKDSRSFGAVKATDIISHKVLILE